MVEHISAISAGCVMLDLSREEMFCAISVLTQLGQIAEICSTILKLPTQSVPFEIALNCNYEV